MPSALERSRSSQDALLQLEKGTASPPAQLNEAAQIIAIDLQLCGTHPEIQRNTPIQKNAAPKEEWVLRWLLKKLKSEKNYRVEPASFLLLRQIVDLIPPKSLATLLKDNKFMAIMGHSISDLEEEVVAAVHNSSSAEFCWDSESSHTLADSPHAEKRCKKGTKRKRSTENDDADAMDIDEKPQSPASCLLAFVRILDCIYGLVALAQRTVGVDDVASAHLKYALKAEPDSIAVILGKSFKVAAVSTSQFTKWHKVTDLQHLLYVLPAILDLWDLRSSRQDDAENKSSNDSFAKSCFAQALALQLAVRSCNLDTDERAQVLHGLERLIALHVVLPARAAFFARGGSGIDYTADEPDWSPVKPVTDTLRPIFIEESLDKGASNKKSVWDAAELLPEFFDTAVRAVPRDTFRRQTHEAAWLETLFVAVAELTFSIVKKENGPSYISTFVQTLEQLFRIALNRKVQLSLHTLLTHASYTGLLKDDLAQVEWNLTALLIKLGVDIFLPNSGLTDSTRLLNALLQKILLQWRSSSYGDEESKIIKESVVIPLLHGFTSARDLPTFIHLWNEQLVAIEQARSQDERLSLFSVWEDDELCSVYGDLMKTSLTDAQVATLEQRGALEIKGENGKISESTNAYAWFVVLEAGFRSRVRSPNNEEFKETLKSIAETLRSTLSSSKQKLHWRWRLWRLARDLMENTLQIIDSSVHAAITDLLDVAVKSIQRIHKALTKRPGLFLEAFEAFRFVLVCAQDSDTSETSSKLQTLIAIIEQFVKAVSTEEISAPLKSTWSGCIEDMNSSVALSIGYLAMLLKLPDVWQHIKPEMRRSFFDQMAVLGAKQYSLLSSPSLDTVPSTAQFLQAWASLVSHEYLLNAPRLVNDLIYVLAGKIKNDAVNRKFVVESLQKVPASLVTRGQRGIILDLLQDIVLKKETHTDVTVGLLSVMARLADLPKSSAAVTSDWEPIWDIAKAISLDGSERDLQIMKSFRNLHRAVIAKLLVASEEDRSKLFKTTPRKVTSKASKLRSLDYNSMDSFFLRISLQQLWKHREHLSEAFDAPELDECRRHILELLVSDLKAARDQYKKEIPRNTLQLTKVLDALEDFEDLATDHAEIEKHLLKIETFVERSLNPSPSLQRLIRRRILAERGLQKEITQPTMQCAETLSLESLYGAEQQLFIKATTERFRSMSSDSLTEVIQGVKETGFRGENAVHRLLVAGLAVAALAPTEDKESSVSKELSSLCTAVTDAVHTSTCIAQFALATECLDILLRNHIRSITQWNIDNVLSAISICASRSGPQIGSEFAGTIYIRLCRLMGTLLGLHRQKLGGRFHLVVLAMQRLLNCLFARAKRRHHRRARAEAAHGQPHWLAPFQASHAVHFTRLLTSLCDPTVSAVSRPTQSGPGYEGLTDQTKKAKRIAGQYLQYLIMEYAQSSLRGSLTPEVKTAIIPGLYAVLDVMSRDTMRALNAGLDVSGRAVFKALYDDYVKFGKWNKA